MKQIKAIEFDSELTFQLDAIRSVTDLFIGQTIEKTTYSFQEGEQNSDTFISAVANSLNISDEQFLSNIQSIQSNNQIKQSTELYGRHFSVSNFIIFYITP